MRQGGMENKTDNRSDFDGDGSVVAAMVVGLGILTLTLFPFMLPAIAVLAIFVLPLLAIPLVLALPIALIAAPVLAVRAWRRRRHAAERRVSTVSIASPRHPAS
jgi:membrane protein implicated in regulation of membrane protease activity